MSLADNALLTGSRAGMVWRGLVRRSVARASRAERPSPHSMSKSAGELTCRRAAVRRQPCRNSSWAGKSVWRPRCCCCPAHLGVDCRCRAIDPSGADRTARRGVALLVISEELDELFHDLRSNRGADGGHLGRAAATTLAIERRSRGSPDGGRGRTRRATGCVHPGAPPGAASETTRGAAQCLKLPVASPSNGTLAWRLPSVAAREARRALGHHAHRGPADSRGGDARDRFMIFTFLGKEPLHAHRCFLSSAAHLDVRLGRAADQGDSPRAVRTGAGARILGQRLEYQARKVN